MEMYILTDCAAEMNYTPEVFLGEDAEDKAKQRLKELYEDYTSEPEYVDHADLWGTSAEIVYTDDTYDRLDIFYVKTEDGRTNTMTQKRKDELFDNMLNHISELVSGNDLKDTLHCIGFTDEEMTECEIEIKEEED